MEETPSIAQLPPAELTPSQTIGRHRRQRHRHGKNGKPKSHMDGERKHEEQVVPSGVGRKNPQRQKNDQKPIDETKAQDGRQQNPQKKKSKPRKKKIVALWWTKHLPEGTVDPITLDPLDTLKYPPFALVATEPYEAVPEWPIPETNEHDSKLQVDQQQEREAEILRQQWGEQFAKGNEDDGSNERNIVSSKRHYHLYDGRALAYYMVSQLQFIDPLNRRDLTRNELVNLDQYLIRHGFQRQVVEAYDAKGVTISTAGAVGNTAAGRAAILQQEAQVLLQALFGGTSVSTSRSNDDNRIANEYQAYESTRNRQRRGRNRPPQSQSVDDTGIYGAPGGLLVIDDDLNPGLRGDAQEFIPANQGGTGLTRWPPSNLASHSTRRNEFDFPSLSETVSSVPPAEQEVEPQKKVLPKAKTLAKIGSAVKPTDPEELQRQFEAREAARKKAMISNLTYGSNPIPWSEPQAIPTTITTTPISCAPSDAQVERNRALAEALGVTPKTVRLTSGWARPTDQALQRDEFGNELNATVYPDSLIMQARERMALVIKLEKKWKSFLADDTAASLPLTKMDRPTRSFVHEYSDYWRLHTESFDPEPNRYIHCVKLRDTSAPNPLLSEVARHWRPTMTPLLTSSDHASHQTAGQPTMGREFPEPPSRVPLALKPRSMQTTQEPVPTLATAGGVSLGGGPSLTMVEPAGFNSRADGLTQSRERPKLELQKRTLPLELSPSSALNVSDEIKRFREKQLEKEERERLEKERKQRLLESAFASDDEAEEDHDVGSESSEEWEEQEALYSGSDDE